MQFYGAIDLLKNELRNAVVQNLGSAPASPSPGQLYYDTAGSTLYWWDGTTWQAAKGGAAVSYGNVVTEQTFGASSANGVATTVSRSDHAHGNPAHTNAAHSTIPLNVLLPATNSYSMGGFNLTNLADPVNPQDAATKNYTDNAIAGLSWKDSCRLATTASFGASIPVGPQTVDGVATNVGDRVLIKNQATAAQNGIYIAQSAGLTWQRATDADVGTELEQMAVFIEEGSVNADTAWVLTTNMPITVGTTGLTYVQFGAGTVYVAGAGLTLTGNTFDVVAGDTSLIVNADELHVNTAVIATVAALNAKASKYAAALNGTASPETVTHNLNTRDISLAVYNGASPYTAVQVDWDAATVNTATVRYNPNLGSGYRVVVFG